MGQADRNRQKIKGKRGLADRQEHRRLSLAKLPSPEAPQQPVHPPTDLKARPRADKILINVYFKPAIHISVIPL